MAAENLGRLREARLVVLHPVPLRYSMGFLGLWGCAFLWRPLGQWAKAFQETARSPPCDRKLFEERNRAGRRGILRIRVSQESARGTFILHPVTEGL